ncbi:YtpI family protein [Mesobacillus harenae]|uniref:YtpI family protein n=1 Tax=Mesobacillus harenae TaxID=2213203 RepID=UPI00157FF0AE|nr:YtpI family protein [Mesobacillus harenae]
MPVLVVLIVISFSLYVFYKIKYVRSNRPIEKDWISSKSRIALGMFVGLFGLNQLFLFQTTVTYIVAAVFIILGTLNVWTGFKSYQHYLPYAAKEAADARNNN